MEMKSINKVKDCVISVRRSQKKTTTKIVCICKRKQLTAPKINAIIVFALVLIIIAFKTTCDVEIVNGL